MFCDGRVALKHLVRTKEAELDGNGWIFLKLHFGLLLLFACSEQEIKAKVEEEANSAGPAPK